jgi:hypothetical protein
VAIEAVESLQSEVKKIDPARSLTATEQSKLSHVKNVVELHNETTRGHQCHVFDGVFDVVHVHGWHNREDTHVDSDLLRVPHSPRSQ